jgi:hypothetical protein
VGDTGFEPVTSSVSVKVAEWRADLAGGGLSLRRCGNDRSRLRRSVSRLVSTRPTCSSLSVVTGRGGPARWSLLPSQGTVAVLDLNRRSVEGYGAESCGHNDSVDAGLAAVLGALIGGLVAVGTTLVQGRRDKDARDEQNRVQRVELRLQTYIDLSESSRTLRYAALRRFEGHPPPPVTEIDAILTQLSRAYYMIELLAPSDTARKAKALRDSAEQLWLRSAELAGAPKVSWEGAVLETRSAAQAFRKHVKDELPFAQDDAGCEG